MHKMTLKKVEMLILKKRKCAEDNFGMVVLWNRSIPFFSPKRLNDNHREVYVCSNV